MYESGFLISILLFISLKILKQYDIFKLINRRIEIRNPLSYKEIVNHLKYCNLLVTDSGGLQKEAFFSKTQTLTLRDETEWKETIYLGWNRLVEPIDNQIFHSVEKFFNYYGKTKNIYGNGNAAKLILKKIRKLK